MATIGNYGIADLLSIKFQSLKAFGLNTIEKVVKEELAMHNSLVTDMVGDLAELTTDPQRIYGTSLDGQMTEVDEYGRAPTTKQDFGDTVGFPLKRYQIAISWTADWFEKKTPADLATAVLNAEMGHKKEVINQIKYALFRNANYTFRDHLVDNINLSVKRLVNADSAKIPNGPYGLVFDGATHTHYTANATMTAAAVRAAINTVLEHGHGGDMKMAFNYADEATIRAITGFTGYIDRRIVAPKTTSDTPGTKLDYDDVYDRAIGLFESAEILIKPWVPANYAFVWNSSNASKPLCFRQQSATSLQGLRVPAVYDMFPLHAEYMQAEFGVGVWNRTNGAVLQFNNGTYSDPF